MPSMGGYPQRAECVIGSLRVGVTEVVSQGGYWKPNIFPLKGQKTLSHFSIPRVLCFEKTRKLGTRDDHK